MLDPYRDFILATVERYPRLRATRLLKMLRERGYPRGLTQPDPPARAARRRLVGSVPCSRVRATRAGA